MKKWLILLALLIFAAQVYAQEEDEAQLITGIMEANEPEIIQELTSFDGQLRAQVIRYDCIPVDEDGTEMAYEVLKVTNIGGGFGYPVATQLLNCGGLGAFGLSIVHWGINTDLLYYTDAREGVPDGGGFWLPPLYRVNISDMSLTSLGNGVFSLTRDQYAAWDWNAQTLTVWDIDNGEQVATFDAQIRDAMLAELLWLPDGSGVLYIQVDSLFPATRSYVVHVDLASGEQSLLLETTAQE